MHTHTHAPYTHIKHTCDNCGVIVPRGEWKRGRCAACDWYWQAHDRERPPEYWKDKPPAVDRSGWFHCYRCTILIPYAGLCDDCEERLSPLYPQAIDAGMGGCYNAGGGGLAVPFAEVDAIKCSP